MTEEKDLYALRCSIYGHGEDVRAIKPADVPDGGLVSGSRDKTVKVWKPAGGGTEFLEGHSMMGPTHFIASLCTLPPSTQYPSGLILAGSNDSAIYGFSLDSSQPILKLLGHSNTVSCLAAGNFGTVVSGSWDKSARVWHGQKCVMILEGHQAAVWAVAMFKDLGLTLTGSADKTIRLWRSGNCEKVFKGHEDCVRGLVVLPGLEFLSCSNDATIRMWQTNGDCIHVFSGHTDYIYDIALLNDAGDFVTCSEDRTIRIWQGESCAQTIKLPAKTLWSVACLKNGDIAVAGSDGSIRVFTNHKERKAPADQIEEFENEVADSKATSAKSTIGDLKLDEVAGLEALTVPGKEEGQTLMVREGEAVYVYQWVDEEKTWTKVGDVIGATDTKKKTLEGKEYDYVFNIDVEEGKYLKLPYNKGENPWLVAQRFIEKHDLSQLFLDQIANFIFTNTEDSDTRRFTDTNDACDPFTGGSRYIPSASSSTVPAAIRNPPKDVVRNNTYYPMSRFLKFDAANVVGLENKLIEFNEQVSETDKITPEELKDVMVLTSNPKSATETQLKLLDKIMNWPPEWVFPALDLFRIAVKTDIINQKVTEANGTVICNYLLKHVDAKDQPANQMLAIRTLCNFFEHSVGIQILISEFEKICLSGINCIPTDNKNVETAIATLYLNYSIALRKSIVKDAALITNNSLKIFKDLTDQESLFRMLVCLGTLMENPQSRSILKASNVMAQLVDLSHSEFAIKVRECSKILIDHLS